MVTNMKREEEKNQFGREIGIGHEDGAAPGSKILPKSRTFPCGAAWHC